jgi:hypothetical protein
MLWWHVHVGVITDFCQALDFTFVKVARRTDKIYFVFSYIAFFQEDLNFKKQQKLVANS